MKFNWLADVYHHNSNFQLNHAIFLLKKHIFIGNENILDVGCGDGKITNKIANLVKDGSVIGIDSSQEMVAFATRKFGSNYRNLKFYLGKAEEINFPGYFDLIVSFACLHWVKDQISFLMGARNSLKLKGRILLTLYPKHPTLWNAIEEATLCSKWTTYFNGYLNPHISYDKEIYKSLTDNANLNVILLQEKMPIAMFNKRDDAENFLQSWLPHAEQIPYDLRKKFIVDIIDRFIEKSPPFIGEKIKMPFRRLDAILERHD